MGTGHSKGWNLLLVFLGNTIYALAVAAFLLPNSMITGGTTGLAITFQHYLGVPISVFVLCFNAAMFLLGWLVLGKHFAFTTLISTFYYPVILDVLQRIPGLERMTQDRMLATVCCGLMIGFGIGIVIRAGASTGGMDIPPLVLHKKFGLPVSVSLYVLDFAILILQMLFSNREQILYGILLVLIYTFVLDKVLLMGRSQTQVKIVSKEYVRVNQMIIEQLDRGSTLIEAETGYMHNKQKMVLTVVSNRELVRLNQLVMEIDPNAFMIISKVNEVKGRGFTAQKVYLDH